MCGRDDHVRRQHDGFLLTLSCYGAGSSLGAVRARQSPAARYTTSKHISELENNVSLVAFTLPPCSLFRRLAGRRPPSRLLM